MAHMIRNAALFVFTKECAKVYFDDMNFLHDTSQDAITTCITPHDVYVNLQIDKNPAKMDYIRRRYAPVQVKHGNFDNVSAGCFKATLSKILGLGIIGGSLLVKVPQIVKILKNKNSEGINFLSVLLDLFAITAMTSYSFVSGFPFSSWGDGVSLGVQTLAIAVLVLHFSGDTAKATAFLAAYLAIVTAALSGLTPIKVLWACQAMNIPIVLISKFIQAYTNYSNGSTGQLSAITGFMLFFGSLARIFTSIQETGDTTMIIMYTCSTFANAIIAAQILYYWNVDTKDSKKNDNVKKRE